MTRPTQTALTILGAPFMWVGYSILCFIVMVAKTVQDVRKIWTRKKGQ